jgi:exopolysaccharide/PEP-CTERM locus tyrosine autokinase
MGRIEEALAKLQQAERRGDPDRRSATRPVPSLASRLDHAYGGTPIKLDLENMRRDGMLVQKDQQQRLTDQYRAIKRPILRNASVATDAAIDRGNLIMVASAFAEEGKTFTAINLSLSIALEQDWSVVLVDGDTSKRHLTTLLGLENAPGLTELLRDPALTFESLVIPTDIPGLAILPAGKRDDRTSELFASARMTALCTDMCRADAHRAIVFDSTPLLMSTESPVLGTQVGQVVLVVRANRTPRKSVLQARDKLDAKRPINLVLNQADWGDDIGGADYYSYGS